MTYEEAKIESFKVKWKITKRIINGKCWCLNIEPLESIFYNNEKIVICAFENKFKDFAEHTVKLHNDSLGYIYECKSNQNVPIKEYKQTLNKETIDILNKAFKDFNKPQKPKKVTMPKYTKEEIQSHIKSVIGENIYDRLDNSIIGTPSIHGDYSKGFDSEGIAFGWEHLHGDVRIGIEYDPTTSTWEGDLHDYRKDRFGEVVLNDDASNLEEFIEYVEKY